MFSGHADEVALKKNNASFAAELAEKAAASSRTSGASTSGTEQGGRRLRQRRQTVYNDGDDEDSYLFCHICGEEFFDRCPGAGVRVTR
jgi:hypothetical protein